MGLFSKKDKKRGTTLTDEDREAASQRKKELKEMRTMKHQLELIKAKTAIAEATQDLLDVTGEEEDENNLLGMGQSEMQLLNILTKGKINSILSPQTTPTAVEEVNSATTQEELAEAKLIADNLPPQLVTQLKGLNPNSVKRAVDLIHNS